RRDVLAANFETLIREMQQGTVLRPAAVVEAPEDPDVIVNSIGMKLKRLSAGSFQMGSPSDEPGRDEEEVQHTVTISRPFAIGVFEVTQEEYLAVTGRNPSEFSAGGKGKALVRDVDTRRLPVERVSWRDAVEFCKKLS